MNIPLALCSLLDWEVLNSPALMGMDLMKRRVRVLMGSLCNLDHKTLVQDILDCIPAVNNWERMMEHRDLFPFGRQHMFIETETRLNYIMTK
jgi:hypothetical protein